MKFLLTLFLFGGYISAQVAPISKLTKPDFKFLPGFKSYKNYKEGLIEEPIAGELFALRGFYISVDSFNENDTLSIYFHPGEREPAWIIGTDGDPDHSIYLMDVLEPESYVGNEWQRFDGWLCRMMYLEYINAKHLNPLIALRSPVEYWLAPALVVRNGRPVTELPSIPYVMNHKTPRQLEYVSYVVTRSGGEQLTAGLIRTGLYPGHDTKIRFYLPSNFEDEITIDVEARFQSDGSIVKERYHFYHRPLPVNSDFK